MNELDHFATKVRGFGTAYRKRRFPIELTCRQVALWLAVIAWAGAFALWFFK